MPGLFRQPPFPTQRRPFVVPAPPPGGGTITGVNVIAYRDPTDLSTYVTSTSLSPVANRLYLATVTGRQAGGVSVTVPTLTGAGLTWDQVDTSERLSVGKRTTLFRAMGSGSSGALTADFAGQTQQASEIIVDEFTGVDTGGTNGSAAIVQDMPANGGSAAAPTAVLAAGITAGNATYGTYAGNADADVVPGTGYTELGEARGTTPAGLAGTEWRADGQTTVDWATNATNWVVIAVELKAGAGGGSNVIASWADAVTQSDALARVGTFLRTTTETVTQADAWTRSGTYLRQLSEAVQQADVLAGSKLLIRSIADSVTHADAWTRSGTFLRTMTNSVTQADAVTRTVGFVRSMTNSVTQADAWSRALSTARSFTESVTHADSMAGLKVILRSMTNSVTSADAWVRSGTFVRTMTNSVTQADSWTRIGTFLRTMTNAVAQADAWVGSATGAVQAAFTSAVSHADSWVRSGTFVRTMTESVSQADAWTRSRLLLRTMTNSVTHADTMTRAVSFLRTMTHTVTHADAVTRSATYARSFAEAVAHSAEFSGGLFVAVTGLAGSRIMEAARRAGTAIMAVIPSRPSGSAAGGPGSIITEASAEDDVAGYATGGPGSDINEGR